MTEYEFIDKDGSFTSEILCDRCESRKECNADDTPCKAYKLIEGIE